MDEAERDVGHRLAVGDRDRQRVMRDPALGVQRAVDRIDDHAHAVVAVVDLAALLGADRELVALVAERVELVEHELLGGVVDLERAVAAAAAGAGLDARSAVVGTSASIRSSPVTARRQTPSQSASRAERVEVISDLCCQTWVSP